MVYRFIEAILKEYDYCSRVTKKKHFNKILVMFERNEQKFQSSNKCWVCDKVRDHCHVTEKYRGSAH